jgi:hypothetical protein
VSEDAWENKRIVIRAGSTRTVELTTGERVRFAKEALEGVASQVRSSFLPMHVEHLAVLPPVGRWVDAKVVEADDGEFELLMEGELIPQLVHRGEDFDPLALMPADTATGEVPKTTLRVLTESRNFEDEDFQAIRRGAPIEVGQENRWASLPPLEWVFVIPVVWGAVRFAGSFFDELGRISAQKVAAWIEVSSKRSREPQRDRLVTLRFDLPGGGFVSGYIVGPHDGDAEAATADGLSAAGALAEWVGAQVELGLIPGLQRAAFVWNEGRWNLAWYVTDGSAVYTTRWFERNAPDATRILGRPILGDLADDASTGPSTFFPETPDEA